MGSIEPVSLEMTAVLYHQQRMIVFASERVWQKSHCIASINNCDLFAPPKNGETKVKRTKPNKSSILLINVFEQFYSRIKALEN